VGKIKTLELNEAQRQALENCFRTHGSAAVRSRCQIILLKAQSRSAMDIAAIVSVCSMSVHNWVKRYQHGGISSLLTKPGQGRKKILKVEEDAPLITQSLKEHRQSLKAAKALYEAKGGKVVSEESFRLF
jgi:transposase